jgi:putative ABC transport system substrate-binding protein
MYWISQGANMPNAMRRREFIAGLGSAAAWPLVAQAQQRAIPVIGYLNAGTDEAIRSLTAAFRRGLGEFGYVEGQNVELLYRWGDARYDRLPALALDLAQHRVDLIVATGGNATALAAKAATTTIPIVFTSAADPVQLGLVPNISHPGGNITGVSFLLLALIPKRLELLQKVIGQGGSVAYLANPTGTGSAAEMAEVESADRALGMQLVVENVSTPTEIEAAFATLSGKQIIGVLLAGDPLFYFQRDRVATLAARYKLPVSAGVREVVEAGGLMSYGANVAEAWHLVGTYAGRILKGEKPGDLPVQQSVRVEFVVNLRSAKALDLTIPPAVLALADEVIE